MVLFGKPSIVNQSRLLHQKKYLMHFIMQLMHNELLDKQCFFNNQMDIKTSLDQQIQSKQKIIKIFIQYLISWKLVYLIIIIRLTRSNSSWNIIVNTQKIYCLSNPKSNEIYSLRGINTQRLKTKQYITQFLVPFQNC